MAGGWDSKFMLKCFSWRQRYSYIRLRKRWQLLQKISDGFHSQMHDFIKKYLLHLKKLYFIIF